MLHAQVDSATSTADCVAGSIVGTRDIVLGAEPTRERCCHEEIWTRDYEIATCTKTIRFLNSPHTSVWEKRIGLEKYTRQSNVTWTLIYFPRNTWLCFAYESKNNGGFHQRQYCCSIVVDARCDCFLVDIQRHVFFVRCIWRSRFSEIQWFLRGRTALE